MGFMAMLGVLSLIGIVINPGAPGIFSTVLTLVVVPTLYVLFAEKLRMKVI